jgi:hypothetical protein
MTIRRRFPNPCTDRPATTNFLYLIIFAVVASLGHVAVSCWLTQQDAPGLDLDATNNAFFLPSVVGGSKAGGDKEALLRAKRNRQAHFNPRSLGLKENKKNTTLFDTTASVGSVSEGNGTAATAESSLAQQNNPRIDKRRYDTKNTTSIQPVGLTLEDQNKTVGAETLQPHPKPLPLIHEVNRTSSFQSPPPPGGDRAVPLKSQPLHPNDSDLQPDKSHVSSIQNVVPTIVEGHDDAPLPTEHSQQQQQQQQQARPSNRSRFETFNVTDTLSLQETGVTPLEIEPAKSQLLSHQTSMGQGQNPTPSTNQNASTLKDPIATLPRQQQQMMHRNNPGLFTEPNDDNNSTSSTSSSGTSSTSTSPTTIVVVVEGELGNFLSHICYAMGLQLWLRDRHGLNNTELLLLPSIDPRKYSNTRQDLMRCFPRLRDKFQDMLPDRVNYLDLIHEKFNERVELQNIWLDYVLPGGFQDRIQLLDRISQQEGNSILTTNDEKLYYVNSTDIVDDSLDAFMEMMQLYNQTLAGFQVPKSKYSHISLPFLISRNLQFFVMMDRYYDELIPLFEFDHAKCCAESPHPSETVFHFRDFQTEMGFLSYSTDLKFGGREELPPNRVATELLAHLPSNTSKVAMTSRFSYQPASQSYVEALQNGRGIPTRVISGQTAVQDFCFLQQAQEELVGITYSTFVQWAAILGRAKVARLYSYDTVLTERKFRPGINAKRASYNWTNPKLASKIKFPSFISEELVEFQRRQREGDKITLDEYQEIIARQAMQRAKALRAQARKEVGGGAREVSPNSSKGRRQRGETASIVVHLDGGLGNFLSTIAFSMGVQLWLRDRFALNATKLVLLPNPDNENYSKVRNNLLSCFPRIREMFEKQLPAELELLGNVKAEHYSVSNQQETWMDRFLPGGRAQRKDLQKRMRKLDGRSVVTGQNLDIIDDALTAFSRVARLGEYRSAGDALRGLRHAGAISIPFLDSRSLQFSVMMDKYYDELITFFEFDRTQCCPQVPDPNETVLDLRNCRAVRGSAWNTTPPDGICQELPPHRVAYELFGHLSNTSGTDRVAIASRFPDHPETQSYVQALHEERGIPTRVVSSRAAIEEFCFLRSAQKDLTGMAASVYVKWAALMSNATNSRLYVHHTPFTEHYFGGIKSELISYNWTNPALAARIKYHHFVSQELDDDRKETNTTVDTQRSLENTTVETQ